MLNKINNIGIFFEDCYKEWSVREYARAVKISPPTASKILKELEKQKFLNKREDRGFLLFRINRENSVMKHLSQIYWEIKFSEFLEYLEKKLTPSAIVLFGSLSKLEARKESDIDIAIFSSIKEEINLNKFEKELGREIQILRFECFEKVNKQLKTPILNGCILRGYLS